MPGITNPAEEYFKDGLWGWDGSAWRKLPLMWGYNDRWSEQVIGTAAGGGDATGNGVAVLEGKVHVLQALSVRHNAGVAKHLQVYTTAGGINLTLMENFEAASDLHYLWSGAIVLEKDDFVSVWVGAPGDGKEGYLQLVGYKMKIAE